MLNQQRKLLYIAEQKSQTQLPYSANLMNCANMLRKTVLSIKYIWIADTADLAQIVRLFGKCFAILKRAKLINLLPWSLADMAEMLLILCLFCISKYHNTVLRSLAYMKAISQQKSAIDWHITNRLQAEIERSYQDEGGIYEYSQSECRYT